MYIVGYVINMVARCLAAVGSVFRSLSDLLTGLLPALLPPAKLRALTRHCYGHNYAANDAGFVPLPGLFAWELDLLDGYNIRSGRMLVLGAGRGRETIALARRGLTVVGVELNENAIQAASRLALEAGVQAPFHRADFLQLPYKPASFDYLLLSSIMYSATPGLSNRQAWLRNMLRVLSPVGLAILSFEAGHHPRSRLGRLRIRITQALARLPGANPAYQPGDTCEQPGHFLHAFAHEQELREEFSGAGVFIHEIKWKEGFVVAGAPAPLSGQSERQVQTLARM